MPVREFHPFERHLQTPLYACIGFSLFTASLAHHYADTHHLHHLVRTGLVLFTNIASFGILWVFKFLILNRIFATPPDPELAAEG